MLTEFTVLGSETLFWLLLRTVIAISGLTVIYTNHTPFDFTVLRSRGKQNIVKLALGVAAIGLYTYRIVVESRLELLPQLVAVALVVDPIESYTSDTAKCLLCIFWILESFIDDIGARTQEEKVHFIAQLVLVLLISISWYPVATIDTRPEFLGKYFEKLKAQFGLVAPSESSKVAQD